MSIKLSKVRAQLPKKVIQAADRKTKPLLKEMKLADVRQQRGITQEDLARRLKIRQSSLSRFENRETMRISTLKDHIEAMGGKLRIQAVFNDVIIPLDL